MTGPLSGRVAVVTGASRGIGRSTALALARAGARVVGAARSPGGGEGLETYVRCDVSRPEDVDELFLRAEERGPLWALVCAAGICERAPLEATSDELWARTIATNLTGTFLCCRRALASMKAAGGGRIITIASLSGVYATDKFPGLGAYNVSKYGVVGLTEMLALEGRDHGVSAVCLSPGAVDTPMLRQAAPHLRPGLGPDDVGRLIVALLDPALAPISGANIPIFSNR